MRCILISLAIVFCVLLVFKSGSLYKRLSKRYGIEAKKGNKRDADYRDQDRPNGDSVDDDGSDDQNDDEDNRRGIRKTASNSSGVLEMAVDGANGIGNIDDWNY